MKLLSYFENLLGDKALKSYIFNALKWLDVYACCLKFLATCMIDTAELTVRT